MKTLFLAVLFFSHVGWAATAELRTGAAAVEQFSYEQRDPLHVSVKHGTVEKLIKLPYSIISIDKIHVLLENKDGKAIAQELLIVALSVGNRTQEIRVYAPNRSADVVLSSKIDPVCSVQNEGDFYWDSLEELQQKIRLVEKNKTAALEIAVREKYEQKSARFKFSGCAFSLLKN